ncbi:MAG: dienelactone hydrolase family protein [bacterium]|nr:dienelactone hydrolase family protein [bacterium]MDE0440048.1 dienelactone hydrolase family protein [bacterium]
MCFNHDSEPPVPEGDREATGRDLTLTARDGNEFAAFEATGATPSETAVVVLPDVRGLYRFYKELAMRFAQAGHDAVAIDYFGRTAGIAERPNDWDFWPHVHGTTFAGIRDDVTAAVSHLRTARPGRSVFTVGFCFGGSSSWHQAANGLGLAGAIGFYGKPRRPEETSGAIDRVAGMASPILALMGGDDPSIPLDSVEEFRAALEEAGTPHEVVVYPGAPHSFFDRHYEDFADDSADAWRRVLEFIETNKAR